MSKCNKTEDDEEYGAKDEADTERATQRPLLASDAEFPPPPPPPNGSSLSCSNPDLVQVVSNNLQGGILSLALIIIHYLKLATPPTTVNKKLSLSVLLKWSMFPDLS